MNQREAKSIAGSLGFPTKMPGTSYGLPAARCIAGAKLAKIKGTVCSVCYALHGKAAYQQPRASLGMHRRLASIGHPLWIAAMVSLLLHEHAKERIRVDCGGAGVRRQRQGGSRYQWNETGYHRWHDSGDLQSVEHLAAICTVAQCTPRIKHWLPTQELGMVADYLERGGKVPDNLVIRASSVMMDDHHRRAWPYTSSVFTGAPKIDGHNCPSAQQDHKCGAYRACWSDAVPHVNYQAH